MSQKRKHRIACPFCGREQEVELYDSILVDEEPELRAALLSNRVNRVRCEGCGKDFRIDKPLVYQDRESRVLIQYDPLVGGRTLEEAEETFRAARAELEKWLQEANGLLDDEAWEAAKFYDSRTRTRRSAIEAYERFLAENPASAHAKEARARLAELKGEGPR